MTDLDRRLREKLKQQIGFLEHSCGAYDSGFEDEATRIAIVVRILIHNTNHSASLLSQLRSRDMRLLSTCEDIGGNRPGYFEGMAITRFANASRGGSRGPKLADTRHNYFLPVESMVAPNGDSTGTPYIHPLRHRNKRRQ
jgi:hypothetical protein